MEVSKIHLSSSESEMMQNTDIILTKNRVLSKMKELLEEIQDKQLQFVNSRDLGSTGIFSTMPKISRGENYLGLPWLILDYPRISSKDDLFFVRTMFWWGKFFSTTLHVSGLHKKNVSGRIINSFRELEAYHIGIHADPWVHHFEADNYRPIAKMEEQEFKEAAIAAAHLKISITFPLKDWEKAPGILFERWKYILELCGSIS